MKVVILTTSVYGVAGHHLPEIIKCPDIEIAMVIVSQGEIRDKVKHYSRKIKKALNIGAAGAYNGIVMRKWYKEDVGNYTKIQNAEELCIRHNIPFRYVPFTNSEETRDALVQTNSALVLSLGNGYIQKEIYSIPKYGMINIHHEVLPQYRNAQSIIWQLYNGSSETGYTIHKISQKLDAGDILYQERLPITFMDTLAETVSFNYARLYDASAKGLVKVLADFKQYYEQAQPQATGTSYTTPTMRQFMKIKQQFATLKALAK